MGPPCTACSTSCTCCVCVRCLGRLVGGELCRCKQEGTRWTSKRGNDPTAPSPALPRHDFAPVIPWPVFGHAMHGTRVYDSEDCCLFLFHVSIFCCGCFGASRCRVRAGGRDARLTEAPPPPPPLLLLLVVPPPTTPLAVSLFAFNHVVVLYVSGKCIIYRHTHTNRQEAPGHPTRPRIGGHVSPSLTPPLSRCGLLYWLLLLLSASSLPSSLSLVLLLPVSRTVHNVLAKLPLFSRACP